MAPGTVTAAYIVASILFILSLGGLSHQESARRGNLFGIAGMAIAIFATIASDRVDGYGLIIAMMLVGGAVGAVVASKVEMTAMPQLVAMLHSFVGLAAVFVGFATYIDPGAHYVGAEKTIHEVE
ncbi:MAG: NAD(P)(+) transhydrogenase (Re/Si-specific) subunit beta, partial [Gammaproteobacteria bacterium]|nr:NAD(P)(+) transhydrogenase (Re/Si-specific) subunit beta [Gammaproteobacteria bacterium]